jgi:hypothetical protein
MCVVYFKQIRAVLQPLHFNSAATNQIEDQDDLRTSKKNMCSVTRVLAAALLACSSSALCQTIYMASDQSNPAFASMGYWVQCVTPECHSTDGRPV